DPVHDAFRPVPVHFRHHRAGNRHSGRRRQQVRVPLGGALAAHQGQGLARATSPDRSGLIRRPPGRWATLEACPPSPWRVNYLRVQASWPCVSPTNASTATSANRSVPTRPSPWGRNTTTLTLPAALNASVIS